MRFEPERNGYAVDFDNSGTLARTDQDPRSCRRKVFQVDAAGLVRAVLGPHDRVHRHLGMIGFSAEDGPDPIEFIIGEPEFAMKIFGNR